MLELLKKLVEALPKGTYARAAPISWRYIPDTATTKRARDNDDDDNDKEDLQKTKMAKYSDPDEDVDDKARLGL